MCVCLCVCACAGDGECVFADKIHDSVLAFRFYDLN